MKKAAVLLAVLFLAGITGVGVVCANVVGEQEQVMWAQHVLFGEAEAAEGLTATSRVSYDERLFWETECRLGEELDTDTEYQFFQSEQHNYRDFQLSGVRFNGIFGEYHNLDLESGIPIEEGIGKAYWELYQQTKPGEEKEAVIRLADYVEYYPACIDLELPSYISYYDTIYHYNGDDTRLEKQLRIEEAFQEFFKIPVLAEHWMSISVGRREDGWSGSRGMGTVAFKTDGWFDMGTVNAITEDGCYFTFNTHSRNGVVVDTSLIPGGYGIYCLPYEQFEDREAEVYEDELAMVYPLDPSVKYVRLNATEDQSRLRMLTTEGNACVLTVIDRATMETVQRLEFARSDSEDFHYWEVCWQDGYILLRMSDDRLILLEERDGRYETALMTSLCPTVSHPELNFYIREINGELPIAWDGERLALSVGGDALETRGWEESCDLAVAVYDKSGLRYLAQLTTSLDVGKYEEYSMDCRFVDVEPVTLRWDE